MKRVNRKTLLGAALLLVCGGIFMFWGSRIARSRPLGMLDFRPLYYGTGCLIQSHDPYDQANLERFYFSQGGLQPTDPSWETYVLTLFNNLPTVFPIMAPFAFLSWGAASSAWLYLTAGLYGLAVVLTWSLVGKDGYATSTFLLGLLLANSEVTLGGGNAAGLVISLCAISVWCFVKGRFAELGVIGLAVGLGIKPHDVGLIWLFFLLTSHLFRKRALATLAVCLCLGLVSAIWTFHVAPAWMQEFLANTARFQLQGGANNPGIGAPGPHARHFGLAVFPGMLIGLQSVIAPFRDDPWFYNLGTYLICGPMLVIWIVTVVRSRYSTSNAYLAVAAVVPLTLLVTYHRTTDAKLLMLTIPACALLWAEGGRIGKIALALTTVGIVMTGDITLTVLGMLIGKVDWSNGGLMHRAALVILTRPIPFVLLAMAVFYLWVYVRRAREGAEAGGSSAAIH